MRTSTADPISMQMIITTDSTVRIFKSLPFRPSKASKEAPAKSQPTNRLHVHALRARSDRIDLLRQSRPRVYRCRWNPGTRRTDNKRTRPTVDHMLLLMIRPSSENRVEKIKRTSGKWTASGCQISVRQKLGNSLMLSLYRNGDGIQSLSDFFNLHFNRVAFGENGEFNGFIFFCQQGLVGKIEF